MERSSAITEGNFWRNERYKNHPQLLRFKNTNVPSLYRDISVLCLFGREKKRL